jgi:hypothetical protein
MKEGKESFNPFAGKKAGKEEEGRGKGKRKKGKRKAMGRK